MAEAVQEEDGRVLLATVPVDHGRRVSTLDTHAPKEYHRYALIFECPDNAIESTPMAVAPAGDLERARLVLSRFCSALRRLCI